MKHKVLITAFCVFITLLTACNVLNVADSSTNVQKSIPVTDSSNVPESSGNTQTSVPDTPTQIPDPGVSIPVFTLPVTPPKIDSQPSQGNTGDPIDPPGTLQDPSVFRKPDQTDVGKTVKLSAEIMMNIQPDSVERTFVYVYLPAKQQGRLLLFSTPTLEEMYTTVTVFEPEFEGGAGLCEAMQGEFTAQITDILNISYQEGYYIRNASYYSKEKYDKMNSGEVIDINSFVGGNTDAEVQYYFCWLTTETENNAPMQEVAPGISLYLTANLAPEQSERIQTSVTVFSRIVERFELQDALGL